MADCETQPMANTCSTQPVKDRMGNYTFDELVARIERLDTELRLAKEDHQRCCELVAAMHMAAIGGVRGPMRGVVQDIADLRADRDYLRLEIDRARQRR